MEEKNTIFYYLSQVLIIFGFIIIVQNIFCLLFGESNQGHSALFALGNDGLSTGITFQFLSISVLIVLFRFIFFTDLLIKNLSIALRTMLLIVSNIATIASFIIIFKWFPVDMWEPWLMFFICFGISFFASLFVTMYKEKLENKRMEEALKRLKKKELD